MLKALIKKLKSQDTEWNRLRGWLWTSKHIFIGHQFKPVLLEQRPGFVSHQTAVKKIFSGSVVDVSSHRQYDISAFSCQ